MKRTAESIAESIALRACEESCFATPGRYVCYVSAHKGVAVVDPGAFVKSPGFVRLALEEHRDILPMWTFGDESIMPQMLQPPEWLTKLQEHCKSITGLLVGLKH